MNLDAPDTDTSAPDAPAPPDGDLRLQPAGPPPTRRMPRGLWIAAGGGLVLVGALALGLALPGEPPDMAAPGAKTLDIQVAARPQPPAAPPPGTPLEVLPEAMAKAAPHNPPPEPPPRPDVDLAQAPRAPEAAPWSEDDLRRPASMVPPATFDCRRARTPAERVVCADPALAQADQDLAAAYDQALAAGVPDWRLERQQRRWLRAREDAAREAPAAVAEVYAARIVELQAQADIAPPAEPPPWPSSW
jgi:uncharacterized protein YecT (DUF1311 family)